MLESDDVVPANDGTESEGITSHGVVTINEDGS